MEEKAADAAAAAVDQDAAVYCSEHPYPPGATAAPAGSGAGGICAFCLQEKLGMLVSSSKSSPFHPPPPAASASPSSPPTKVVPSQKTTLSSSVSLVVPAPGGGLKRSKSVAPRPEEPVAPPATKADNHPRRKSFWSFLHLSSSSSSTSTHNKSASSSTAANNGGGAGAAARRNSVSASLGGRLEAIAEPPESPEGRRSEGLASSSSFGRKVARSRSVGCGSRSFSGDFLERLSTGFGDCALRRVESHREPNHSKPKAAPGGDEVNEHALRHHRIKCAGFFGGMMGAAAAPPPASSSYWLSAPDGGAGASGAGGARAHGSRSWAWSLASPMRALRPSSSSASGKSIMAAPHGRGSGVPAMSAVATS